MTGDETAMKEEMGPAPTRSNYERLREENIKRNEEFLKEIGINSTNHDISDQAPIKRTKSQPKKRAIAEVDDEEIYAEPKRRSSRLSKDHIVDDDEMPAAIVERRESIRPVKAEKKEQIEVKVDGDETVRLDISCADLRGYIATHNEEHSEEVSDEIIAHTLRRVNQMTNKQMANRIKVMTRLDKLLACYYALRAVGLVELCESTKNALRIRHKVEVPSAVEGDVFVSANGDGDAQIGGKEPDCAGDALTGDHGEAEGKVLTDGRAEDNGDAENKEEALPATSPSSPSSQTTTRVTRTRSSRGRPESPRDQVEMDQGAEDEEVVLLGDGVRTEEVEAFVEVTGSPRDTAVRYLDGAKQRGLEPRVECAVAYFFETQP